MWYVNGMSRRYRLPRFNDQILSEIIFGIENQDVDYMLDIGTGCLYSSDYPEEGPSSEDNLVELPPWTSADGYQLMVSFTNSRQDPGLRQKLAAELNSKERGVFRRFRNVLSEDPENLKQWYDFKDKRMKSYIRSWYRSRFADLSDDVPEEEGDLSEGALLAEFEVIHLDAPDDYCRTLLDAYVADDPVKRKIVDCFSAKEAFEVMCGGSPCGALVYERVEDRAAVIIYYIEEEDRENGLFGLMFDLFNRELERKGIVKVSMPFPEGAQFIRHMLSEHGAEVGEPSDSGVYGVADWNSGTESAELVYVL